MSAAMRFDFPMPAVPASHTAPSVSPRAAAWRLALSEWPGLALKAKLRRGDERQVKWQGRAAGMWAWMTGRRATQISLGG